MSVSVCLSVTFVHCGHRVQWIPDIFACLDRWISLLLTDNASPGSSDGMMPGFLVEEGGMEKLVIVAISLILLTESLDVYISYKFGGLLSSTSVVNAAQPCTAGIDQHSVFSSTFTRGQHICVSQLLTRGRHC